MLTNFKLASANKVKFGLNSLFYRAGPTTLSTHMLKISIVSIHAIILQLAFHAAWLRSLTQWLPRDIYQTEGPRAFVTFLTNALLTAVPSKSNVSKRNRVTPPLQVGDVAQAKRKGNYDNTDARANVEGTGENVGILRPPAKVSASNIPVEKETDNDPGSKEIEGGGRDDAAGAEDGRPDNKAHKAAGISTSNKVLDDGQGRAAPMSENQLIQE